VCAEPAPDGWVLSGRVDSVPAAEFAAALVVPVTMPDGSVTVMIVPTDRDALVRTPLAVTNRESNSAVQFDGVAVSAADALPADGTVVRDWTLRRARVALAALAALSGALFIIGMDLGHPFRFWKAYLQPNFGSLMTWMIWLHTIYLLILVGELIAYRQGKDGLAKNLTFIGAPVGIALIGVIGGLFGVIAARPYWNASVLPLMFFVSSLVAGIGLLILLHLLFSPAAGTAQYATTARELARIFMIGIVVGLLAAGANALVIAYPGVPAHSEGLRLVLFGPYWWTIWIVHLLFGVLVPLALLIWNRRSLLNIGIAAALMVWTFVMVPLNIVIPGLAYPTPELEGLKRAAVHHRLSFDYFPTTIEWLVVIFAIGLALTLFTVGYKLVLEPYQKRLFASSTTSGEQLTGGDA
ncbi:MAG: NrfD/PsrC family molybdoenzyme membrane anchor subunit, partial [Caldilinea sp.]